MTQPMRSAWWRAAILAVALTAGRAPGQPGDGAVASGDAVQPDVYVPDSAEADAWIAQARRAAGAENWPQAARDFHRAIINHAQRVTRVEPGLYRSVAEVVNHEVCDLPTEGRRVFLQIAEPAARRALENARNPRDSAALLEVVERYFVTDAGFEAALEAAALAVERADFDRAADLYERLRVHHPGGRSQSMEMACRLAVVHALWGREEEARSWVQAAGADGKLAWQGQERPISPLVESLLETVHPSTQPADDGRWPTFAGSDQRNRRADLNVRRLAALWYAGESGEPDTSVDRDQRDGRARRPLATNAVVGRDLVFVNDGGRVRALHLASGNELWAYGESDTVEDRAPVETDVPPWYAATLHQGRIFACLGDADATAYGYTEGGGAAALVCLDAATGTPVWRTERAVLGSDEQELAFESIPVVAENRVHIVARRKRTFGFEDAFLYRLSAADGQVEARTHLGSASTGGFGYRRPTLAIPTRCGPFIVVATNLGTVAAVDRLTGTIRWLRVYERIDEEQWRRQGRGGRRDTEPWQYNPVVCEASHLFVLPNDAENLLVLSCGDGRLLYRVPLGDLFNIQAILGVEDQTIFGVGDQAFAFDLGTKEARWHSALPEGGEVRGRGVLTAEQMIVPLEEGLAAFDLTDGASEFQRWELGEGGGNLLAADGRLLTAGRDGMTAYARRSRVLQNLLDQMNAAPQDVVPALEYAEVLFRTGDVQEAVAALDEAIARAGGFARSIEIGDRRRLFNDCLLFARQLRQGEAFAPEVVEGLYRRAAQCAADTTANLDYRFQWARFAESQAEWEQAVRLYHQILVDRSLAAAEYAPEGENAANAGAAAESAIRALIDAQGRAVYAAYDEQARGLLEAGLRDGDPELLTRVVQVFPNSLAAADALVGRARLQARQGQFTQAIRSLQTVLSRYADEVRPERLMVQIAQTYGAAGRPVHASKWLMHARRWYPDATVEVEGDPVRLAQYRPAWAEMSDAENRRRPRLSPPLDGSYERSFPERMELLDPVLDDVRGTDHGLYAVYAGSGLMAYDAAEGAPLWPTPVDCAIRPDLLLAPEDRLVFCTKHRIYCLDARDGKQHWTFGERPAGLDRPGADPEHFDALVTFACDGGTLYALRSDGFAVALDVKTGATRWRRQHDHPPAGPVAVNDRWLVYQTPRLGQPAHVVLDVTDGSVIRVIDAFEERHVVRVFLSLADTLVLVTADSVFSFDPEDGGRLWTVRRDRGIETGGVALDLRGAYLPDDNLQVEKVDLLDGEVLWRSEPPTGQAWRGAEDVSVDLVEGQVIVSSERRVFALSERDGRILWEGTVRRGTRFSHRLITEDYVLAVDSPPEQFDEPRTAYFYDLRNASGLIPSEGGVEVLGVIDDVRRITVRDGALLISTPRAIRAWTAAAQQGQAGGGGSDPETP